MLIRSTNIVYNPILFSIKLSSSCRWASIFFLILRSGFLAITFNGLDHLKVQGSSDCDRQIFSLTECPGSSSRDEEINSDDNNDDDENIEQEIPSVIPFP
jgi:hypothetical protein